MIKENKWNEVCINLAPFKGDKQKYWVVGYNKGGIGTQLFDVDKDVKFFIERKIQKVFDDKEFDIIRNTKKFKKVMERHLSTFQKEKRHNYRIEKDCSTEDVTLKFKKKKGGIVNIPAKCITRNPSQY